MYVNKESSSNQVNRSFAINKCPVTFALDKIGGRWKALIIYQLLNGPMRYSTLKKAIPGVTEKMLIQQLKELEADKLVIRDVKPVVPPHVTYSLTQAGIALTPVIESMAQWGKVYADYEFDNFAVQGN